MHEQDLAIVKALVPVAWADGEFAEREKETLEALLDVYGATAEEKAALREYAKEKRTLEDIDLRDLSADDRRVLLQHAVLLSFADGDQSDRERAFLDRLVGKLKIPRADAEAMMKSAAERAERLLHLL
jgi:tellurite resistance protein